MQRNTLLKHIAMLREGKIVINHAMLMAMPQYPPVHSYCLSVSVCVRVFFSLLLLLRFCAIRKAGVWFICDIAPHYGAIGPVMK